MELKVWVEGIQRIVCGVNEKTTCQDVVFALAHATGKTGRFTLIERWRNSERLLAPSEQPLKVLLKWGEHSNDVQFILQWSPLESSTNPSSNNNKSGHLVQSGKVVGESSCSESSSHSHSSSPLSKENPASLLHQFPSSSSSPGGSVPLQKSSSSSSKTIRSSPSTSLWNSPFRQSQSTMPTAISSDVPTSSKSPRVGGSSQSHHQQNPSPSPGNGKLVISPPPYREPPSPATYPNPTPPLISPQGGGGSGSGQGSPAIKSLPLPPYREPPPPHLPKGGGSTSSFCEGPISLNGYVNGYNTPPQVDYGKLTSPSTSAQQNQNHSQQREGGFPPPPSFSHNNANEKPKDNNRLSNGDIPSSNQNRSSFRTAPQSPSVNSNSHYRELIGIVNSQREKLTSQQADLTQFDAEIMFWEGKTREQQKHVDLLNKEISRLELISAQHDSQALSLAHLEEEHESAQMESVVLRTEMNALRKELEKLDEEIEECKKRIKILMEELHLTQLQMAQRQQEWLERETAAIAEIEKLRGDLDITKEETDAATELSESLDQEVQFIEASLSEKKKQMERLVAAMKEANLQSLSIQPPEDLIEVHHRSGSTRRMIGSPRQLENAAPTSKNPHGVWV